MEPRIQYAQTKDGVSIAFWTLGEGEPLVYMPTLSSHCELELQNPDIRAWYERLGRNRKLIRYDGRGTGLSEREATDFSLDGRMLDLDAVVDRLGSEPFAVFASFTAGPVAIAYASRRPERVSHLLLWCSYARGSDISQMPQVQGILGLVDKDWVLYTETVAHAAGGWSEGEQAHRFAAIMREGTTQETVKSAITALFDVDVSGLLPLMATPTLVLQRRAGLPPLHIARGLASRIPDARLALVEGSSLSPSQGDNEAVASAIDEFLGEDEEATGKGESPTPGAFRTILFTDMEGSTTLTQRLGDARARELLRQHERIVREALRAHGGAEVKTMGDGFMASFSSATRALECAIAMQRAFAQRNEGLPARPEALEGRAERQRPAHASTHSAGSGQAGSPRADRDAGASLEPLHVRIGLNAGEPIQEDADLFGTAVNLAARIAADAEAGKILASDVVRQLVAGKDFLFADRGEANIKGFDEPVRLYEVRWRPPSTELRTGFDSPASVGGSG